jgi:solute carrier family 25 carnitine/acylcarnitine transporter 20/29
VSADYRIDQTVYSAPYSGEPGQQQTGYFREWRLERPCDILQVYLLIKNIDIWTVGKFRDRVLTGVRSLADDVKRGERGYLPWKRAGDLKHTLPSRRQRENTSVSTEVFSSISSPEAAKGKGKGRTRS